MQSSFSDTNETNYKSIIEKENRQLSGHLSIKQHMAKIGD